MRRKRRHRLSLTQARFSLPRFSARLRSTRDDLAAEPAGARLREKCPYWFDFGLALAAQCAGEAAFAGLAALVADAFRGRYKSLLTRAHTAVDCEEKLVFMRLLTREERHGAAAARAHAPCQMAQLSLAATRYGARRNPPIPVHTRPLTPLAFLAPRSVQRGAQQHAVLPGVALQHRGAHGGGADHASDASAENGAR
jgi:hypothetical protein